MHLDPIFPQIIKVLLVIISICLIVRKIGQPGPIGYIIAGLLLGPSFLQAETDINTISRLGGFGVIFLLFFVGQEISIKQISANWRLAILGTLCQILLSVTVVFIFGYILGWAWERSLLIGFATSLSSTAMAINILDDYKEMDTRVGRDVITVLVSQDLAIVPMMIILGSLAGENLPAHLHANPLWQVLGGLILVAAIVATHMASRNGRQILEFIKDDNELQFLVPIFFCLFFAFLTGYFDISTALGSFIAGIIVSSLGHKDWFHKKLESFKIIFVGLFFVSMGLMIDIYFLYNHALLVVAFSVAAFTVNSIVNIAMFRFLGRSWEESIYAGSLLAQIGEFSFILSATGKQMGIIDDFSYQLVMVVTGITLFFTPAWTFLVRHGFKIFKERWGQV